jgi:hypothetical protein
MNYLALLLLAVACTTVMGQVVPVPTVTDGTTSDYTILDLINGFPDSPGPVSTGAYLNGFQAEINGFTQPIGCAPFPATPVCVAATSAVYYGSNVSPDYIIWTSNNYATVDPSLSTTSPTSQDPSTPIVPTSWWTSVSSTAVYLGTTSISNGVNIFSPNIYLAQSATPITTWTVDNWGFPALPATTTNPITRFNYLIAVTPFGTSISTLTAISTQTSVGGDPQFVGLQGQSFQFHGLADEVFSLVSSPELQVNSLFKFIASGACNYNNTVCWTHPGTYLSQIGFQFGEKQITLQSGSHSAGLTLLIDNKAISVSSHLHVIHSSGNQTMTMIFKENDQVSISTNAFHFKIVNSDFFFNMDFGIKDTSLLQQGAPFLEIDGEVCEKESHSTKRTSAIKSKLSAVYPNIPLHGLIGQTWRNAEYCGRYFEGSVDDYVTGGLFSNDHTFNYFEPLVGSQSVIV